MGILLAISLGLATPLVTRWLVQETGGYGRATMILSLILYEMVTVVGILLSLWSHDLHYFLACGFASMVLLAALPSVD